MKMTRQAIRRVFEKMLSDLKKNIAVAVACALIVSVSIGGLAFAGVSHYRAAQRTAAAQAAVQAQQVAVQTAEAAGQPTTEVSRGTARTAAADSSGPPAGYTWDDVNLLAHLIFAEANLEPYSGQVAVGAVVINRTRSGQFPSTIAGVVYQPGQYESVGNYYFNSEPPKTAVNAALDALRGWDPSNGAIYFFDPSKVTNGFLWGRPLTVTIGGHRFTK